MDITAKDWVIGRSYEKDDIVRINNFSEPDQKEEFEKGTQRDVILASDANFICINQVKILNDDNSFIGVDPGRGDFFESKILTESSEVEFGLRYLIDPKISYTFKSLIRKSSNDSETSDAYHTNIVIDDNNTNTGIGKIDINKSNGVGIGVKFYDENDLEIHVDNYRPWVRPMATIELAVGEFYHVQLDVESKNIPENANRAQVYIFVYGYKNGGFEFRNVRSTSLSKYFYCKESHVSDHTNYPGAANTWTQDFIWRPSYGCKANYLCDNESMLLGEGGDYVNNLAINSMPLELNLNFNNRTDKEAKAIIHFLQEKHFAYDSIFGLDYKGQRLLSADVQSFNFIYTFPYRNDLRFTCTNFQHSITYRNNNSISATFVCNTESSIRSVESHEGFNDKIDLLFPITINERTEFKKGEKIKLSSITITEETGETLENLIEIYPYRFDENGNAIAGVLLFKEDREDLNIGDPIYIEVDNSLNSVFDIGFARIFRRLNSRSYVFGIGEGFIDEPYEELIILDTGEKIQIDSCEQLTTDVSIRENLNSKLRQNADSSSIGNYLTITDDYADGSKIEIGAKVRIIGENHPFYGSTGVITSIGKEGIALDHSIPKDGVRDIDGGVDLVNQDITWELVSNAMDTDTKGTLKTIDKNSIAPAKVIKLRIDPKDCLSSQPVFPEGKDLEKITSEITDPITGEIKKRILFLKNYLRFELSEDIYPDTYGIEVIPMQDFTVEKGEHFKFIIPAVFGRSSIYLENPDRIPKYPYLKVRNFEHRPTLAFNISHQPKGINSNFVGSYVKHFKKSINQNMSTFNVVFDMRDDEEALEMLQFLESHLGYKKFRFTMPRPYGVDADRITTPAKPFNSVFYCPSWDHEVVYKNNHLINATFVESATNFHEDLLNIEEPCYGAKVYDMSTKHELCTFASAGQAISCGDYYENITSKTNVTPKGVDLIFMVDTTGSMRSILSGSGFAISKYDAVMDLAQKIIVAHDNNIMPGTYSYGGIFDCPEIDSTLKIPPWEDEEQYKRFKVAVEKERVNIGLVFMGGDCSVQFNVAEGQNDTDNYKQDIYNKLAALRGKTYGYGNGEWFTKAFSKCMAQLYNSPRAQTVSDRIVIMMSDGVQFGSNAAGDRSGGRFNGHSPATDNMIRALAAGRDGSLAKRRPTGSALTEHSNQGQSIGAYMSNPTHPDNPGYNPDWYEEKISTTVMYCDIGLPGWISNQNYRYAFDYHPTDNNTTDPTFYFKISDPTNNSGEVGRLIDLIRVVEIITSDSGYQNLFCVSLKNCGPNDIEILNTIINAKAESNPLKWTTKVSKLGLPKGGNLEEPIEISSLNDKSNPAQGGQYYDDPNNKNSLKPDQTTNILWESFNTKYEVFREGDIHQIDGGWAAHPEENQGVNNYGVAFDGMPVRVFTPDGTTSENPTLEIIDYNIGGIDKSEWGPQTKGDYKHLPILKKDEVIDLFFGIKATSVSKLNETIELVFNTKDLKKDEMQCYAKYEYKIEVDLDDVPVPVSEPEPVEPEPVAGASIAVGDIVGIGVWGVEDEPYDQDSDRDFFRNVVLDGIFDSVNWQADGNNGRRQGRVSKTFQGLIDDYGVWTPGSTGNEGSGYSGTPKSTLTSIINNIPTTSTAYAWQMFDLSDSPNWESQVRDGIGDTQSAAVGFQFTATIGQTTYTLGVTKASVYWGVQNYQAMPYIRPAEYANSFWQENAIRIGSPIDNYDIYEIEVISESDPTPPANLISQAQISINNGSQNYFQPYSFDNGAGFMHLPVLVKATCSTLGLDNDDLGMIFIFQNQTFGHHWFTLGLDGMEYYPSEPSWGKYGNEYAPGNSSRREHTCIYIRLVKYTGDGWYNIGIDNNTNDHNTLVLKHPHSGVNTYENACTTAWSPAGQNVPDGYFTHNTLGTIPGGWANGICVARNLGFEALYGPAIESGRGGGNPQIGASYTAAGNNINWSELFDGNFQINNFVEFGSDPEYRAVASLNDAKDINSGWLDGCAGPKGTDWSYYTTAGMTVNDQAWTSYGGNKGWSQVHKFSDNPPQTS